MQIVKATPHCGAEVRGIDLSRPLAGADAAALPVLENSIADG